MSTSLAEDWSSQAVQAENYRARALVATRIELIQALEPEAFESAIGKFLLLVGPKDSDYQTLKQIADDPKRDARVREMALKGFVRLAFQKVAQDPDLSQASVSQAWIDEQILSPILAMIDDESKSKLALEILNSRHAYYGALSSEQREKVHTKVFSILILRPQDEALWHFIRREFPPNYPQVIQFFQKQMDEKADSLNEAVWFRLGDRALVDWEKLEDASKNSLIEKMANGNAVLQMALVDLFPKLLPASREFALRLLDQKGSAAVLGRLRTQGYRP